MPATGALAAETGHAISSPLEFARSDRSPPWLVWGSARNSAAVQYALRGEMLVGEERFVQALEAAERAIRLDPDYAPAHLVRGVALVGASRLAEGIEAVDHAISLDPEAAAVHFYRGVLFQYQRQHAEAIEAVDRAVDLDQSYEIPACAIRSSALNSQGRFAEALKAADRAISAGGNSSRNYILRARALEGLDRFAEAVEAAGQAIRRLGDTTAFAALAKTPLPDHEREKLPAGITVAHLMVAEAHLIRGAALRKSGRYGEAIEALGTTLDIARTDEIVEAVAVQLKALVPANVETLVQQYYDEFMRGGKNFKPAALSVTELKKLIARGEAAKAELEARGTTGRAKAAPRPETQDVKTSKRFRKSRQTLPDLTLVKLRATYDELKDTNLDDPTLSDEERVARARSIKSTYETLKRGDYGFQFEQTVVRKAFAIVKREQRHQARLAL